MGLENGFNRVLYELNVEYEKKEEVQIFSLKTEKIVSTNMIALDCE